MEKILISLLFLLFTNQLIAQKFFIEGDLPLATDQYIYCGGDTIFMHIIVQDSMHNWGVLANENFTLSLVNSKNKTVLKKDFKTDELGLLADFIVLSKGLEGDFFLYKNHTPFSKKIQIKKTRPYQISLKYSLQNNNENLKIEVLNYYAALSHLKLNYILKEVAEKDEIYVYNKGKNSALFTKEKEAKIWLKEGKIYKKHIKQKALISNTLSFNNSGEIRLPLPEKTANNFNYQILIFELLEKDKIVLRDYFLRKV